MTDQRRNLSARARVRIADRLTGFTVDTDETVEAIDALDNHVLQSCEDSQFTWMVRSHWRDEEQPEDYEPEEQEICPACERDGQRDLATRLAQASEVSGRRIAALECQLADLNPIPNLALARRRSVQCILMTSFC